jgi:hypothetical protein
MRAAWTQATPSLPTSIAKMGSTTSFGTGWRVITGGR